MQAVRHPVRGAHGECLCWLQMGEHVLAKDQRTGRLTCRFCGGDGERAMRESDNFQQAWTEHSEEEFYRDIDARQEGPPNPMRLVVPRFLKKMVGRS